MVTPFSSLFFPPIVRQPEAQDPLIAQFTAAMGRPPMSEQEIQAFSMSQNQERTPFAGANIVPQQANAPQLGVAPPGRFQGGSVGMALGIPRSLQGALPGGEFGFGSSHLGGTTPEEVLAEIGGGGEAPTEPRRSRLGGADAVPVPSIGGGGARAGGGVTLPGTQTGGSGAAITNMLQEQERLRLQEEDAKRQATMSLIQSLLGGTGGIGGLLGG